MPSELERDLFGDEFDRPAPGADGMASETARPDAVLLGPDPFPPHRFLFLGGENARRYLMAYCRSLDIATAADESGVAVTEHYHWLEEDDEYVRAWGTIRRAKDDMAKDEAYRRAVYGVLEDVIHRGDVVGVRRVYSDTLMKIFVEDKGSRKRRQDDRKRIAEKPQDEGAPKVVIMLPDNGRINQPKLIEVENTNERDNGSGSNGSNGVAGHED